MLVAADTLGPAPSLSLVEPAARVPNSEVGSNRADLFDGRNL
jgi:hypothetical protein